MRALGVVVDPHGGSPRAYAVILSGTTTAPVLENEFEIRTSSDDTSEQAVELARLLAGRLPGIEFDAAALRIAGPSPVGRRLKAAFSRAHAEGALLFVLRERAASEVLLGDPQTFAKRLGVKKDDLIATARTLSGRKEDAAVAALALLPSV